MVVRQREPCGMTVESGKRTVDTEGEKEEEKKKRKKPEPGRKP